MLTALPLPFTVALSLDACRLVERAMTAKS
jgi:hypothetical protein